MNQVKTKCLTDKILENSECIQDSYKQKSYQRRPNVRLAAEKNGIVAKVTGTVNWFHVEKAMVSLKLKQLTMMYLYILQLL